MAHIKLRHRMAFPALWEAQSFEDGVPMFGLKGIIDPGSANEKLLDKTISEVAKAKWAKPGEAERVLKNIASDKMKNFFMKADYCGNGTEPYEGFEDMYYFTAKNEVQPLVIDKDRSELLKKHGRPYSGCTVISKIDVYAQDNKWGKGMRATLLGVQFVADGEAFAGGSKAKVDDFDDLSDTGEDEEEDNDLA